YDVATDARPEQVRQLFGFCRTVPVGESFGVIRVQQKTDAGFLSIEVATFRSDGTYTDGRHPDEVVFSSAREDALRRDFTINGMFFDPLTDEVIDYVGGQADLKAEVLRAIGEPLERFREDKLRLLRAVRFATRFRFRLDPKTADAVRAMADQITVVSAERIAGELHKLLTDPRRADGLHLLAEVRLVAPIIPELRDALAEGGDWSHLVRVVERLPADAGFRLALAALLHRLGRKAASEVCLRLKLSNAERERVEWLVQNQHALADAPGRRPRRPRRGVGARGAGGGGGPAGGGRGGGGEARRPGRALGGVAARAAPGGADPASGADGRRPEGARAEAGAGVQAAARRGAGGAA